jgi:hypothetical protein
MTLGMFLLSVALTIPPPVPRSEELVPAPDPVTWAPAQRGDTLAPGSAISKVLASHGYDSEQVRLLTKELARYRTPRTLRTPRTPAHREPVDPAPHHGARRTRAHRAHPLRSTVL